MSADVHFYVISGGLGSLIVLGLRIAVRVGRSMQKLDDYIDSADKTFQQIDKRIVWLEQRRR